MESQIQGELQALLRHAEAQSTGKTKKQATVKPEAVVLLEEFLRIFVTAAVQRAGSLAKQENREKISLQDIEKILPQLLLDMS